MFLRVSGVSRQEDERWSDYEVSGMGDRPGFKRRLDTLDSHAHGLPRSLAAPKVFNPPGHSKGQAACANTTQCSPPIDLELAP